MVLKSNVFGTRGSGVGGRYRCPLSGLQRNSHPTPARGECNSFYKINPRPRRPETAGDIRLVRDLIFTFAFLLHKVQDGDGPIRAPQEPSDALHHPFYLVLFFRSHPARTGRRGCLGQTPRPARAFRPQEADGECGQRGPGSRQAPWLDTTNQ